MYQTDDHMFGRKGLHIDIKLSIQMIIHKLVDNNSVAMITESEIL
jgi:hypothetical protein